MMYKPHPPRRRMPRWASALLVLAIAAVLLVPGPWQRVSLVSTTVLQPIQLGISSMTDDVGGVVDTVQRVRSLASENEQYKDQIDSLNSQLAQMRELQVENQDLRNLVGLEQQSGQGNLIPSLVIAQDDAPYVEAVTIDKGMTDGVKNGDVVVTQAGVVGRVEEVDPTSSKVRLITDINSSIAVRLQTQDRTTGVLRGQSKGNLLVIAYIQQTDTVSPGDVVITSGLGGLFPEGLVVGQVSGVQKNDADPFQSAVVSPATDMSKLERLYVLANSAAS